tara:strand:+ start:4904 stop:5278 length:375 start_codon:yes stop_codon:yes gene_type:complete
MKLIHTMKNVKYKQKKYKKLKDRVVRINAPVVIVPDGKDRPMPVLTDRYFMDDVWNYLEKHQAPIIDHWLEEGKLALVFDNKEQAVIFKLKYPNMNNWVNEDPDKGPYPGPGMYPDMLFPGRNC